MSNGQTVNQQFITKFSRDLCAFLRQRPGVDLESLTHSTPEMSFDLGKARKNKLIHNRAGDRIFVVSLTGVAYIRYNSTTGSKYRLRLGPYSTPFQKLYLENEAQADKSVSIIIGYGAFIHFASAYQENFKTKILDITDQNVGAGVSYEFLSLSGEFGYLKECLVFSPSTDFSVVVTVDDDEILNKTYTQYCVITEVVKDISAFEATDSDGNPLGKYVVNLKNINFRESITIEAKNNSGSPIVFGNLFCKYRTI